MANTPGFIFPSFYSSKNDLKEDLKQRDIKANFKPFNLESFMHSLTKNNHDPVLESLSHHGIKGQHWGVRNKESLKRGPSSDHKKAAPLRGRPVHSLTNKQLKTANERANLEQNFNRLNPSKRQLGARKVKAILGTVGITSVVSFANSPLGKKTMTQGKNFLQSQLAKTPKAIVKARVGAL